MTLRTAPLTPLFRDIFISNPPAINSFRDIALAISMKTKEGDIYMGGGRGRGSVCCGTKQKGMAIAQEGSCLSF
jgi:hypothetical protein